VDDRRPVVSGDVQLTTYFAERDRAGGRYLADALLDAYERHGVRLSVLLRGIEGFGTRHRLRSGQLETAALDLPIVAIAVDGRDRIRTVLPEVLRLSGHGLVTLEGVRTASGPVVPPGEAGGEAKLTLYCGRGERAGGVPAFVALVELLHRAGLTGATVLLGVDGTAGGRRHRATFLSHNRSVPVMIVAVGSSAGIAGALAGLGQLPVRPVATLERVLVCKRDGEVLAAPERLGHEGPPRWQKLMVYASEATLVGGLPLHAQLLRRLLGAGAAGASTLRGIWGFHGDHPPHGDRPLSLRRHVPTVTTVVDTPDRIQRWFAIADAATTETGLVTCETVPALQARDPRARGPEPDPDWDGPPAPPRR
jgi:PII-like signaling protein